MSFESFVPFKRNMHLPAVLFVKADWCPHCHDMAPHMKRCQQSLRDQMPVYVIDADKHKQVVQQLGVEGFPTVIVVGADRKMREYNGTRNGAAIAKFARQYI